MIGKSHIAILLFCFGSILFAQNKITVDAVVDIDKKSITISQTIIYKNESDDALKEIYLNDWNNSYSTKTTPLAKRFEEEFSTKFHLARREQRGFTTITSLKDISNNKLEFTNLINHPDGNSTYMRCSVFK